MKNTLVIAFAGLALVAMGSTLAAGPAQVPGPLFTSPLFAALQIGQSPVSAASGCTAQVTCLSGARISCQGSVCDEYDGCWIQCDEQTILCPGFNTSPPYCPEPRY